jgi:hypothetical protein
VTAIMAGRAHPALGFRSCLGILRLGDKHGAARLAGGLRAGAHLRGRSYKSVNGG